MKERRKDEKAESRREKKRNRTFVRGLVLFGAGRIDVLRSLECSRSGREPRKDRDPGGRRARKKECGHPKETLDGKHREKHRPEDVARKRPRHLRRNHIDAAVELVAGCEHDRKNPNDRCPDHRLEPPVRAPKEDRKERSDRGADAGRRTPVALRREECEEGVHRGRSCQARKDHRARVRAVAREAVDETPDPVGREVGGLNPARGNVRERSRIEKRHHGGGKIESTEVGRSVDKPAEPKERADVGGILKFVRRGHG